jgi:hypothetical protein
VKVNDPKDGEPFGDIEPCHSSLGHGSRLWEKQN